MESLNADVLREIAWQLRDKDWKSFRRTCRATARALSTQIDFLWRLWPLGPSCCEVWEAIPPNLLSTFSAAYRIRLCICAEREGEPPVPPDFYAQKLQAMAYTAFNARLNRPNGAMEFCLLLREGSQRYLTALETINLFGCSIRLEEFNAPVLHVPIDCGAVTIEYQRRGSHDLRVGKHFPRRLFAEQARLLLPSSFHALHSLTRAKCAFDLAFCNESINTDAPWSLEEVFVEEATAAIDLILQFRCFVRLKAVKPEYVMFYIVFYEKRVAMVDDALLLQLAETSRDLDKYQCTSIVVTGNCFFTEWFDSVRDRIAATISEHPVQSPKQH